MLTVQVAGKGKVIEVGVVGGVTGGVVGGVTGGASAGTVIGELFPATVMGIVWIAVVSKTSSSFAPPTHGSGKGNGLPLAIEIGLMDVAFVTVVFALQAAAFVDAQRGVPKRYVVFVGSVRDVVALSAVTFTHVGAVCATSGAAR